MPTWWVAWQFLMESSANAVAFSGVVMDELVPVTTWLDKYYPLAHNFILECKCGAGGWGCDFCATRIHARGGQPKRLNWAGQPGKRERERERERESQSGAHRPGGLN